MLVPLEPPQVTYRDSFIQGCHSCHERWHTPAGPGGAWIRSVVAHAVWNKYLIERLCDVGHLGSCHTCSERDIRAWQAKRHWQLSRRMAIVSSTRQPAVCVHSTEHYGHGGCL